jgi:SAM-dependent methyltransferase
MPSNLAERFDAVIPWSKRLAREMPLLLQLAEAAGPRVLVPACGTGGHVAELALHGLQVLGFDSDEGALEVAAQKIDAHREAIRAASGAAELQQLRMEDGAELGPQFDIALCLGNALPGLSQPGQIAAALAGMASALRPGGTFFTQNLNFDLRWKEQSHWFPVLTGETADEEVLLVKFADYDAEFINFHAMFLNRPKPHGIWESNVVSTRWLPLFQHRMQEWLAGAGLRDLMYWGAYERSPFDVAKSSDLLIAATRG